MLPPRELVPVAGWLAAAGRCARCGYRVPAIYPVGEAMAGLAPVVAFLLGWPPVAILMAALTVAVGAGLLFLALDRRR